MEINQIKHPARKQVLGYVKITRAAGAESECRRAETMLRHVLESGGEDGGFGGRKGWWCRSVVGVVASPCGIGGV